MVRKGLVKRLVGITIGLLLILMTTVGCGVATTIDQSKAQDNSAANKPAENKVGTENRFKDVKPDITLKLSYQEPATNSPETTAANAFKDYVESHTGGKVQIQIYPGGQLGNEREVIEAIKAGNIDLGMVADGPVAGFIPEVSVLAIPYLFKSAPVAWAVLDGKFGQDLKNLINQKTGLKVMALSENGFRSFSNNKKPIHTVEDLKGLKIRVMQDKMYVSMVNALGAQATPMAGGNELYSALQQKVVDGQENPLDGILAYKLYEVQPYITVDNHTFSTKFLFMNDKKLASLPPDVQSILKDASGIWKSQLQGPKESASVQANYTMGAMTDKVKEIYPLPASEKERFKNAAQPAVIEYMKGTVGSEWVEKVQKAAKEAEASL